ncbi:hypothetical protein [Belnapia rosea]|uniref:Uncharacterized protein n=1 Tax=Belnapia rosea TaxID=938405 RepID=A0A1G6SQK5_9PROT|nr:hypothetical protein [Belnapia rosea]SDD19119.1 hypothetical protein SAMN04487779_1005118 [Belnapia rosea]
MPRDRVMPAAEAGFQAAIDHYCAAFGRDALPCLFAARGGAEPIAAAMLAHAVTARRPLAYAAIAEALGAPPPPMSGAL